MAAEVNGIERINILDPKHLLKFAQDHSKEGRANLAKAVTECFLNDLSDVERNLAGAILMNLVRQAEIDLREALADKLSVLDNVPKDLIVYLANDQISVARPVLTHSPILQDIDLMHIIQSKGAEYWQAIARRESLTPVVSDKLIDTRDPSTVLALIDNQRVHLQKGSLKKLIKVSVRSDELQAPLLRRPEIDSDTAVELYMVVSQALRREIAGRFQVSQQSIERALDSLVQEMTNESRGKTDVSDDMSALAKKFKERGEITFDLLVKTLRRGQMAFFVALFGQKTDFPPEAIVRMINKDGSKPFVTLCKSIGMYKPDIASIFLLSRGLRAGDKIVDQRELAMALKYFDTLKDFDIEGMVKIWRKNPDSI